MKISVILTAIISLVVSSIATANVPSKLTKQNGPETRFLNYFMPAWDYDGDGCYPSVLIGSDNSVNSGLGIGGFENGNCRGVQDLYQSNIYGRAACYNSNGSGDKVSNGIGRRCALYYGIYMRKDQVSKGGGSAGHTHDVENAVVFAKCDSNCNDAVNYTVTHVGRSAHGNLNVDTYADHPKETRIKGNHARLVYHQGGALTHSVRIASFGENAENHSGSWHFPTLVTWNEMVGLGSITNSDLKTTLNNLNLGSATPSMNDSHIKVEVNKSRPSEYREFFIADTNYQITSASIPSSEYRALRHIESQRCLDVNNSATHNGTFVETYKCTGNDNQKWRYDPATKQLISKLSGGTKCLDVSGNGSHVRGETLELYDCHSGSNDQKFTFTNQTHDRILIRIADAFDQNIATQGLGDASRVVLKGSNDSFIGRQWTWEEFTQ